MEKNGDREKTEGNLTIRIIKGLKEEVAWIEEPAKIEVNPKPCYCHRDGCISSSIIR